MFGKKKKILEILAFGIAIIFGSNNVQAASNVTVLPGNGGTLPMLKIEPQLLM